MPKIVLCFQGRKYVCADNGLDAIVSNLPKKPKTLFFIGLCFQEKNMFAGMGTLCQKLFYVSKEKVCFQASAQAPAKNLDT